MKKLLLTSDGFINPKIGQEFLALVSKKPADIKVLFDSTAAQGQEGPMHYMYESEKELIDLGIPKENIFWLDMKNIPAAGEINNYDVMYVCGGNTFYLMNEFKSIGFDKKIIEFVNSGKVYVGVSAGSIIMCPDISIARPFDSNNVGLESMKGFGFTDKVITPHYQRKEKEVIDEIAAKIPYEVLPLCDGQALEVLDGVGKIIE